jgi:hypothetical protein
MKTRIPLLIACALCTLGIAAAQTSPSTSVDKTVGQTATISWTAPTTYTTGASIASGTTITYAVDALKLTTGTACSSTSIGSPQASSLTTTSYVTPTYTGTGIYCYAVTAQVAGVTSAPSDVVQATVTAPIPNPPSATIQ